MLAFKKLKKYRNENIEIICPLSYGCDGDEYRSIVIKAGKKIFGSKFKPLVEFMPKYDYYKLLSEASVCVYCNNRQQAMGNIFVALATGSRVVLRKDTSMWDHFTSSGFEITDIDMLDIISFDELINYPDEMGEHNWKCFLETLSSENSYNKWKAVFNVILKEKPN